MRGLRDVLPASHRSALERGGAYHSPAPAQSSVQCICPNTDASFTTTGSRTTKRITGKMQIPKGSTIFTGSLLARSSARNRRLSRISSLKTRSAVGHVAAQFDRLAQRRHKRARFVQPQAIRKRRQSIDRAAAGAGFRAHQQQVHAHRSMLLDHLAADPVKRGFEAQDRRQHTRPSGRADPETRLHTVRPMCVDAGKCRHPARKWPERS